MNERIARCRAAKRSGLGFSLTAPSAPRFLEYGWARNKQASSSRCAPFEGIEQLKPAEPTEIPIRRTQCCPLLQGERRQRSVSGESSAHVRLNQRFAQNAAVLLRRSDERDVRTLDPLINDAAGLFAR